MALNFDGLNQLAIRRFNDWVNDILPGGKVVGNEYRCSNICGGSGQSMGFNLSTGVWKDFGDGGAQGGDPIALVAASRSISMGDAYKWLADKLGYTNGSGPVHHEKITNLSKQSEILAPPPLDVAPPKFSGHHWCYRDFDGRAMFYIERVDVDGKKQFFPKSWSESRGGWVTRAWPSKRPLYGLELLAARPNSPVMIVEGEKACDAARLLCPAYIVVTWSGGAQAWNKTEWAPIFARKKVLLWPDADTAGVKAMNDIIKILNGKVDEIKILDVSDMTEGFDAADYKVESCAWGVWATPRARLIHKPTPTVVADDQPPHDDTPMPTEREAPVIIGPDRFKESRAVASHWPGEFGFYDLVENEKTGAVKFVPMYNELAKWCFANKNLCFTDKEQLKYDGKKWRWLEKTALSNLLIKWNKDYLQPAHHDNFIKQLRATCYMEALGIDPDLAAGHLNVENGVVNIAENKLGPHDYKFRFRYVAPIKYDAAAECPRWEQFLCDTFESNVELMDLAQRLFGYILIGGRPFLHKAFVLYGTGRNGKSTFLDVMRAVIGKEAYSSVSMSKLDKEFSLVNLEGKLANIREETPNEAINAEEFKTLVGGGETTVAHKGYDEYQLRVDARFVFACNDMPIFKDKSVGLEERLVFIPFNRFLKEEDRDTLILDKLMAELPGILNWALEGARMMAKQRMIPKYEVLGESKEKYKLETMPIYAWYKEELQIVPANSPLVSTAELYRRYVDDMKQSGNMASSRDRFLKQLRKFIAEDCDKKGIFFARNLRDGSGGARGMDVVRFVHAVPSHGGHAVQQNLYYNKD